MPAALELELALDHRPVAAVVERVQLALRDQLHRQDRAIERAHASDRPSLIACKTIIGFGAPKRAGTSKAHGEPLGAEELAGAKAA